MNKGYLCAKIGRSNTIMQLASRGPHVTGSKRILKEVVGKGIHGIGKLQVSGGSDLQGDRVACVVSRARVFTEVIPVDLGQT